MTTPPTSAPGMPDWSVGRYEDTAASLLPAAEIVVERAAIAPGEHVVDVGCGTGNGALLAAAEGARVTGVDPAVRLLEVARAEASARGLDATFVAGTAAGIPLPDGDADVVMSVFGAIFAPDPAAAIAEMVRVTAPSGRIVLSAWIPEGAIAEVGRMFGMAVAKAVGAPPPAGPPFAWHDRDALAGLFGAHGFAVELSEHPFAFSAPSLDAYVDGEFSTHPLGVAGRAVLEARGEAQPAFERAVAMLAAANEDPDGFRLTSRFVVATARHST